MLFNMKTTFFSLASSFVILSSVLILSSCSKDNTGNYGENATYLIFCADDGTSPETNPKYYNEIDNAITNKELLYTYKNKKYYATHDAFISSQGTFTTQSKSIGRFSDTICWWVQGYQIKNSDTILWVDYILIDDDSNTHSSKYKKYKSVYQGKNFKLSWYITETYYTYYKKNGKLYLSDGKILTKTDNGLIADGSSFTYQKFDLSRLK